MNKNCLTSWAEINLKNLINNFREVKKKVGKNTKIIAAVKSNAYGHGAKVISQTLEKNGVDILGVATVKEAEELRLSGIKSSIMIFSSIPADCAYDAVKYNIQPTVADLKLAKEISKIAKSQKKKVKIHIKVDTGMGRIGIYPDQVNGLIDQVLRMPNLEIYGIFTHFPVADAKDKSFTLKQIRIFQKVIDELKKRQINIPLVSAANSAAILNIPESYFNCVRPGLMLYGMYSSEHVKRVADLKPVFALKSRIVYVKKVKAGQTISYGRTYRVKKPTTVAVISIGYGDGYNRLLSNKGEVIVNGKKARVIGRICMDQTMIDVGHIRCRANLSTERRANLLGLLNQEVVLIGEQKGQKITAEDIARKINTIPYEVTCSLSKRVVRIY